MKRLLRVTLVLLLLGPWHAQAQSLEILPLNHRTADELVPLLRPFLAPGGTLTGQRGELYVRTTPANLAELKKLLATLDKPLRQLMITVLQGEAVRLAQDEARVDADTRVGDNGHVTLGDGAPRDTVGLRIRSTRSRSRNEDVQQVRVLEGSSATIYLGQSVPLGGRSVTTAPGGTQTTDTVEYHEVVTGFAVTPRVSGDQVTLEIGTQRDRPAPSGGGAIEVQGVHTTVRGRFGEWIEIGGVASLENARRTGVIYRSTDQLDDARRVLLKVEALP